MADPTFLHTIKTVAQTKKQPWSASLCHSLVPHTNVDLLLRYAFSCKGAKEQRPWGRAAKINSKYNA